MKMSQRYQVQSPKSEDQRPKSQVPSSKISRFGIIFLVFGLMVFSCNSGTKKAPANKSDESGTAKFAFSEEIHNFGSLMAGEVVSFTFAFKNEGTKTLTITGIDSGCGCTKVNIPNKTIAPGPEAYLEVIYDSAGENGRQLKTITIFSNAETPKKQLFIKANITNEIIKINS